MNLGLENNHGNSLLYAGWNQDQGNIRYLANRPLFTSGENKHEHPLRNAPTLQSRINKLLSVFMLVFTLLTDTAEVRRTLDPGI